MVDGVLFFWYECLEVGLRDPVGEFMLLIKIPWLHCHLIPAAGLLSGQFLVEWDNVDRLKKFPLALCIIYY